MKKPRSLQIKMKYLVISVMTNIKYSLYMNIMDSNRSVFIKNGNFYVVERDKYESLEQLNERGWFVANIQPKNNEQLYEAIRLSRIYINIKYNKCNYNCILMEKIKNIVTNSNLSTSI